MSNLNLPSTINSSISASFGYRGDSILFKDTSVSPGPIYNIHGKVEEGRGLKMYFLSLKCRKNNCRGFGYG